MSHEATGWASRQRGIKPALKVVLWQLCDRYHPDNGCFPSQETLAADCEVSRAALNVYLQELQDRRLIARERRQKAGTRQQERTRYYFPFQPEFEEKLAKCAVEKPCPESGHGDDEAVSRNEGEPSPENGESRVQNLDSNLVKEPVREPVRERGRARDGEEGQAEDQKSLEKRYKALEIGLHNNPWPQILKSSSAWGLKQFVSLLPAERVLAEQRRDAYLAACPKVHSGPRKGEPDAVPLGVYLRDRKFLDVAAIAPRLVSPAVRPSTVTVAPFGPIWAGMRASALLKGPVAVDVPLDVHDVVRQMFDMHRKSSEARAMSYLQGKGITLAADGELVFPDDFYQQEARRRTRDSGYPEVNRLHKLAVSRASCTADPECAIYRDLCEPVPVGSDLFRAWKAHDEAMGFPPLPDHGAMNVVWFPKGGPDGLDAFATTLSDHLQSKRGTDDAA